jgi:hypothetical protein
MQGQQNVKIWVFVETLFRKLKFHWNVTRATVLCMQAYVHFMIRSRWILLLIRNIPDKNWRESKPILYAQAYRLWDNMEKYCRARQATDENMAHAHCMLGTKVYEYTLRICNNAFPLQQRLHKRAFMLRYTYIACLVFSYLQ